MAQRSGAQFTRLPVLALALAVVSPLAAQDPRQPPPAAAVVRLDGAATASPVSSLPPQASSERPAPAPVTQLDDTGRAALDGVPSVSLTIAQPMPLRDIVRLLLAATPMSVVFEPEVAGEFEGDLRNLTLRQALETVLRPRALDYDVEGTVVRVFPRRPQTRMFDVNHVNLRRRWERNLRSASSIPDGAATSLTSSLDSDPLAALEAGVRHLLSDTGRMHVDRPAGLVHVTDFADRLDSVTVYLQAQAERASRQVRIDARVLAVTFHDPTVPSVNWTALAARAGSAVIAPRAASGIQIRDFDAFISALAEQGTVKTLAAPRVVAMNNEPALMRVGVQQVYFEPASRLVDTRGVVPASALEGLTLTVTAQVASDGVVLLHVAPSYAERRGEVRGERGVVVPILTVMEADSLVRVRDGHTVVIAGLLDQRTKTKPGEGFSGLFGAERRESVKSELIVLLTPTVVSPSGGAAAGVQ